MISRFFGSASTGETHVAAIRERLATDDGYAVGEGHATNFSKIACHRCNFCDIFRNIQRERAIP